MCAISEYLINTYHDLSTSINELHIQHVILHTETDIIGCFEKINHSGHFYLSNTQKSPTERMGITLL